MKATITTTARTRRALSRAASHLEANAVPTKDNCRYIAELRRIIDEIKSQKK